MSVRVYLPVSAADLAALVADRRLPAPRRAHAVTAALREAWPDGDDDGWEYAALMAAAAESLGSRDGRRRVVAADVGEVVEAAESGAPESPDDEAPPTLVEVVHDVVWRQVAAAHVDLSDGAHEDDDLAWFATQEIPDLL